MINVEQYFNESEDPAFRKIRINNSPLGVYLGMSIEGLPSIAFLSKRQPIRIDSTKYIAVDQWYEKDNVYWTKFSLLLSNANSIFYTLCEDFIRAVMNCDEEYEALNKAVIDTGMADFIDVEVFMDRDITASLVEYAHSRGVAVIGSNHHFHETPAKEEMVDILRKMQELDADIPKLAVMPANKRDMLALLEATLEMSEDFADRPIITMSMGRDGMISRVAGEIFGSAMTFGAVKKASAPGQIEAKALSNLLYEIHKNINV